MRFAHQFTLAMSLGAMVCGSAIASPTTLDLYHLGESDPGAIAGNPGNNPTIDSGPGAHNLTPDGTPHYSSNVGAPGSTISGPLGTVTVTDTRALHSASWTVTASSTNFTTGTATPAETIPAGDATYHTGTIATTGTITTTPSDITLSNSPQTVVVGSSGSGDNTASWDPTVSVAVPAAAVNGTYTATLTHSVT